MDFLSQEGYLCAMCNQPPKRKILYPCVGGHSLCEKCKIACGRKCFCGLLFNKTPIYLEDFLMKYLRPASAPTNVVYQKKSLSKCSSSNNDDSNNTLFANLLLEKQNSPPNIQANYQNNVKQSGSSCKLQKRITPKYVTINEGHKCNKMQATASNVLTSKRPIHCPDAECEKIIALSSLILHFSFDHPKIVQKNISFGETKIIPININDIQYGKGNCIALMLLSQKGSQVPLSSPSQDIAFPILAARIPCQTKYSPVKNNLIAPKTDKNINSDFDIVLFWLCGTSDNVNCNLEFCNPSKGVSIAYSGPIVSLREDNDPYTVFSRSDCLVMNSSAIEKMNDKHLDDDTLYCNLKICLAKISESLNLF